MKSKGNGENYSLPFVIGVGIFPAGDGAYFAPNLYARARVYAHARKASPEHRGKA